MAKAKVKSETFVAGTQVTPELASELASAVEIKWEAGGLYDDFYIIQADGSTTRKHAHYQSGVYAAIRDRLAELTSATAAR